MIKILIKSYISGKYIELDKKYMKLKDNYKFNNKISNFFVFYIKLQNKYIN